jgi:hypothetical protein
MDNFLKFKKEEYNNFKIEYNEEQLIFINSVLEDSKLLGIPGGGKTQSIIGKVISHYNKNEITRNNNFLILTFSRRACNDFIEKGRRQNKILFNTRNIRTLHSIAGKIIFKILQKRTGAQDTVIICAIDLISNANKDEQNKKSLMEMPEFSNLKVIFVDEAQDISYIQYQLILKISILTNCKVILIGDPNQNIYQFQNGSDQYLLNHPGQTYYLIKNYRSTPHIVNFINQFRPWTEITQTMVSTKKEDDIFNKKPVIFNGKVDDVIQDVINKILSSPFPREEIAIIGPVKKSKPNHDSYTNIGLSLFTNLLNESNIEYVKHYEDTRNDEEGQTDVKRVKGRINLMTIHGAKGLEFHQVFLLNFHTSTMGIIPTEEKYKEFKYLWYVGLSRASYDLNIYIDRFKLPWNELKTCPINLYQNENFKPQFVKELKFQEEIEPMYYTVTDILNSKKLMNDQTLFNLDNIFKYTIEKEKIFDDDIHLIDENNSENNDEDIPSREIKNYKEYSALYGMYIENIFNYYYNQKFNKTPDFIIKLDKMINNTIIIPKNLVSGYKILKLRCPFITKNLIKLSDFSSIKNQFKKHEEEVYSYLCETLNYNYHKEFFIYCENDVIIIPKKELKSLINGLEHIENIDNINNEIKKNKINKNIFRITLFYYQLNNEMAYLWKSDLTEEFNDMEYYTQKVISFINKKDFTEQFTFHPTYKHSKLPIVGELDMLSNERIVDIKFSNNLNIKHILQVLLYNHIVFSSEHSFLSSDKFILEPTIEKEYKLELWNFHLGYKYIIKIDNENPDIYKILKILSRSLCKKLENMIFLYDLKTTGLSYANKKIDIIERHFEEYTLGFVPSTGLIKPINVPFIPFNVTKITGITKTLVDESTNNNMMDDFKKEMYDLLEHCYKPIFIAHNGNNFDHKIMIDKNLITYDKCKLLDSRVIIKLFFNDPIADKSLNDIFQYLFKIKPLVNRATSDVKMLIAIFKRLDITEHKILNMK